MKNVFVLAFLFIFLLAGISRTDSFKINKSSNSSWEWNTFLGSSRNDYGNSIAVDANGNVYIAGTSSATWGQPVDAFADATDAFAVKLNSSGQVQWVTFMGSTNSDYGESIAVDSDGNVYVAGRSYLPWGTPVNAFAGDYGYDAFAAKLDNNGVLLWNSFVGSSKIEYCRSLAIDNSGNVYLAGSSNETWGSPVRAFAGEYDAFAAKLNNSGELQWNTFLGSSGDDAGKCIAVDASGNVYVTGNSYYTWGSPVHEHSEVSFGGYEGFAAKLNSGGVLQWNTFMGSVQDDYGEGIVSDNDGNVYVTGRSNVTWGEPLNSHAGDFYDDAFVVKLSNMGTRLWNTFIGGSYSDEGKCIAVEKDGNVFIAGDSESSWGSPVNDFSGGFYPDAFAANLDANGNRIGNTFFGSLDYDYGESIAVDDNGYFYVTGNSYVTWGTPVTAHTNRDDAFAVKLAKSNIVDIVTDSSLPSDFILSQNYPNPFNPSTVIHYTVPQVAHITLTIYDLKGRIIESLVNSNKPPGQYSVEFQSNNLASGIYFYQLNAGGVLVESKKMLLLH